MEHLQVDFEKGFSDFLDSRVYDEAQGSLFTIDRAAYEAGYKAAGGTPTKSDNIIRVIKKDSDH